MSLNAAFGSKRSGPVRVATYVRISTDEENQPTSLPNQRAKLKAYIASQEDWQHVAEFSDEMTGKTADRPGLQRLLGFVGAGKCDVVLVFKIDRFARRVSVFAQTVDLLDRAGVSFVSATEHFDTGTPIGKMVMQILAVFAEFEGAMIRERVISGMRAKAAQGAWISGPAPYGFARIEGGRLEQVASEASIVQQVFELFVRQRKGTTNVARVLNDQGLRTRSGRRWIAPDVIRVLRNRVAIGEIFYMGEYHTAHHEPLVDKATFEKAQALLARWNETKGQNRGNNSDFLLTGLLVCAHCGRRYIGGHGGKRTLRYRYYRCMTHARDNGQCVATQGIPADPLEEAVLEQLLAVFEDDELIAMALAEGRRRLAELVPRTSDQLAAIRAEVAKVDKSIHNLIQALESGTRAADVILPALEEQRARRLRLDAERESIENFIDDAALVAPTTEEIEATRDLVRDAIQAGDAAQKKAWLKAVIQEIRITSLEDIQPIYRLRPEFSVNSARA